MKKKMILIAAAVVVVAAVLIVIFAARGGDNKASAMWLVKAQGDVAVTDGGGSDVPVEAAPGLELRLGLFDGYCVGTQRESFGWINLDDAKLTKLDEESEVQINRTGRKLELVVDRGSLFFNVTRPLEDDETMEIRSSSMVMAIRGTCGWVSVIDGETFDVYIIEGRVRVAASAAGSMVPAVEEVTAGQRARMSIAGGTPDITLDTFDEADVPAFVLEEAAEDEKIAEHFAAIGIDTPEGPGGPANPDGPTNPDGGFPQGGAAGDISYVMKTEAPELSREIPNVSFTYPVFSGPENVVGPINEYMEALCQNKLDSIGAETEGHFRDFENTDPEGYKNQYTYSVELRHQGLVILNGIYTYNDGLGSTTHVEPSTEIFDNATGENLDIVDLVGGTDMQVREAIKAELKKTTFGAALPDDKLDTMDLSRIKFAISDNDLMVNFQFFLVTGGAGDEEAHFRLPLAKKYGGEGLPGAASAEELPAEGWTDPNAIASGTGWSFDGSVLTLTPEVNDFNEDWRNAGWQSYKEDVTKIVALEGVTEISDYAFQKYTKLEEVILPEGLKKLGQCAFTDCPALKSINFPKSLSTVTGNVFGDCISLESVTIPERVITFQNFVFSGCTGLTSASILCRVETLNGTFKECSNLKEVTLAEGIQNLDQTFSSCGSLESIQLPSTLKSIGTQSFSNAGLVELNVPDGVTQIGPQAFFCCEKLETLWLPASITEISEWAFSGTSALKTIYFAGTQEQWENAVGTTNIGLSEDTQIVFGG